MELPHEKLCELAVHAAGYYWGGYKEGSCEEYLVWSVKTVLLACTYKSSNTGKDHTAYFGVDTGDCVAEYGCNDKRECDQADGAIELFHSQNPSN